VNLTVFMFVFARVAIDGCKFWNKGSCKFGAKCHNKHVCSKCGSSAHRAVNCSMTQGVSGYRTTRVTDKELLAPGASYALIHSISAMPENVTKSVEEIRASAYANADQPAAPAAFGAAPTPGGFGSSATQRFFGGGSTTPGAFGGSATPSLFGAPSGGAFGASAATPAFGASAATPAFGASAATPAFGASATPSAFGAPTGGAFGSTTSAFGASTAPSPFGAPPSTPSAFGAPSTPSAGGGLFGAPSTTSAFGAAPTPGGFGASSSLFGGGASGSFGAPSAGGFGASAPSTSAFGAAPSTQTAFGAAPASGGLFGAAPSPFGSSAPSTSAFGGGSLFGAAPTPSPFGAPQTGFGASAPAQSGGLFGASAPSTSAFGASAQGGGLFGASASATPSAFGATTSAFGASKPSGGLFGAPSTPATGGLFGAPTSSTLGGGAFGASTPAPGGGLFGASAPSTGGGFFGASAPAATPAFGGFGAAPSTPSAFGASTGGGMFGAPAPASTGGGLFGSAPSAAPSAFGAPSGGIFGAPASASGGSLFGAPKPAGSSLFGASAPATGGSLFGAPAPASQPSGGLFGSAPTTGGGMFGAAASSAAPSTSLFGLAPAGGGLSTFQPNTGSLAFSGMQQPTSAMSPYGSPLVPPQLHLVSTEPAPAKKSLLGTVQSPAAGNAATAFPVRSLTPRSPWLTSRGGLSREAKPRGSVLVPSPGGAAQAVGTPVSSTRPGSAVSVATPSSAGWLFKPRENPRALFIRPDGAPASPAPSVALAVSPSRTAERSPERRQVNFTEDREPMQTKVPSIRSEVLPKLTAEGYSMSPTLEQMERMLERGGQDALAAIDNFSISNETFGRVKWLEPVDVRGLDLNKIVLFEQACLCLYPEDRGVAPPEEGQGLKKRAEVTLYGILPKKSGDAAKARYEEKIRKQTEKAGAELIEYNADTGIWKFSLQL